MEAIINTNQKEIRPIREKLFDKSVALHRLLLEIALTNLGVLKDPKTDVLFEEFANSAMMFNQSVWTREYINQPVVLKSQLYYEVARRFPEQGIEIPYPQRDVHIKRTPEDKDNGGKT